MVRAALGGVVALVYTVAPVAAQTATDVAPPEVPSLDQSANCDDTGPPDPPPPPGAPRAQDFFRSFHVPLPPAPLYDPPGPKRVGLQAGHWLVNQVPPELA